MLITQASLLRQRSTKQTQDLGARILYPAVFVHARSQGSDSLIRASCFNIEGLEVALDAAS